MGFNFNSKVVLITGSTRGIGMVTAELFAKHGATIILNGRTRENLDKTLSEFVAKGYSVLGVSADVGNEEEVASMINEVMERFGRIDVLINNAAVFDVGSLEEISGSDWDEMLHTNLKGIFTMCKAVAPIMKTRGSGSIVNIVSQIAVVGALFSDVSSHHYAASKGGVISLTKSLAKELGRFNVRVNGVMPGLIETNATKNFIKKIGQYPKILEDIALQRLGTPSEVADTCLFLASDMSSYITGEITTVNGGLF